MEKMQILDEKVRNAIETIKSLRAENADLKMKMQELERLKNEVVKFKQKRDKAKEQVEEILNTIDKIQLDLKF